MTHCKNLVKYHNEEIFTDLISANADMSYLLICWIIQMKKITVYKTQQVNPNKNVTSTLPSIIDRWDNIKQ